MALPRGLGAFGLRFGMQARFWLRLGLFSILFALARDLFTADRVVCAAGRLSRSTPLGDRAECFLQLSWRSARDNVELL